MVVKLSYRQNYFKLNKNRALPFSSDTFLISMNKIIIIKKYVGMRAKTPSAVINPFLESNRNLW
jgi:hypothetical protein